MSGYVPTMVSEFGYGLWTCSAALVVIERLVVSFRPSFYEDDAVSVPRSFALVFVGNVSFAPAFSSNRVLLPDGLRDGLHSHAAGR